MEFCSTTQKTLLAAIMMFAAGCSTSEDYVDYTSLPSAPEPAADPAAADDVATSDDQSTPEPQTASDSATEAPKDSGTDFVHTVTSTNTEASVPSGQDSTTDVAEQPADAVGQEPDDPSPPAASGNSAEPTDTAGTANTADPSETPDSTASTVGEPSVPAEPRPIELLIPEKKFRTEGDSSALRITYDDIDLLKILNMEPVPPDAQKHFPDWLQDLDGQKIRLRGFMYPTFIATGIMRFGMARDNGICCFVKQPKIYDMIDVTLADGEETDYIEGKPFDVEGTFRIDPEADDSELFQLYRIEDARVLP